MSLHLDLKFINLLSNRLPRFARKKDYLFNFRCTICGDSKTNLRKARGYLYRSKDQKSFMMHCQNCKASMSFNNFLKTVDPNLHNEYVLERYSEKMHEQKQQIEFEQPKPTIETKPKEVIDLLFDRLDTLPEDNIAVQYFKSRNLNEKWMNRLYFVDDVSKINKLSDKYSLNNHEPRLVIPYFFDRKLIGVTCRALKGETLRYVTVRIDESKPLVFNIDEIKSDETIYVTEGPFDSMFLPNAIAVSGTGFNKLEELPFNKDKMIIIIDNQPRNQQVVKVMNSIVEKGYKTFIWPSNMEEKDINDLSLKGMTQKQILRIINENSFQGLEAKMRFVAWKRV